MIDEGKSRCKERESENVKGRDKEEFFCGYELKEPNILLCLALKAFQYSLSPPVIGIRLRIKCQLAQVVLCHSPQLGQMSQVLFPEPES